MGDAVDALKEQRKTEWFEHLAGNCKDTCRHCEDNERASEEADREMGLDDGLEDVGCK